MNQEQNQNKQTPELEVKRLSAKPQRGAFSCGESAIDSFFIDKAFKRQRDLDKITFCAHLLGNSTPVGFYTMSITVESDKDIEGHNGRFRLSEGFFCAVHLDYIAVHQRMQGQGIGKYLAAHAVREFGHIALKIGVCALTLTALENHSDLVKFYESLGFARYGKNESKGKMFLPARSAIELLEK